MLPSHVPKPWPCPSANNPCPVGLVLRTDAFSFAQYSACMIYDARTRCTTAICIGLRAGEYKQFLGYYKAALSFSASPLFLPVVLVDFMKQSSARWLHYNRLSLLAIANSREVNVREIGDDRGLPTDQRLDLDSATRKLTFLNDEFGIIRSICQTQNRFLDTIEELLLEETKLSAAGDHSPQADAAAGLLEEIPYLRESFASALQYIDRDMSNIQGLVQTVRTPKGVAPEDLDVADRVRHTASSPRRKAARILSLPKRQ